MVQSSRGALVTKKRVSVLRDTWQVFASPTRGSLQNLKFRCSVQMISVNISAKLNGLCTARYRCQLRCNTQSLWLHQHKREPEHDLATAINRCKRRRNIQYLRQIFLVDDYGRHKLATRESISKSRCTQFRVGHTELHTDESMHIVTRDSF